MSAVSVRRHFHWLLSGLSVLVCLLGAIIVRQGQRILALEDLIAYSQTAGVPRGSTFGPLHVRDMSGHPQLLEFKKLNSRPTVVYIFRPTCIWCQRNSTYMRALSTHIHGKYDIIGLSLEKVNLQDSVQSEDLEFPVYTDVSTSDLARYRLQSTPETLVVSPQGKIIKDWIGAYTQEPIRSGVELFFSIRFPPISESRGL